MRILYMGTPDFSVKVLDALYNNFEVVAVITQPDKPVGRKLVMTPPPVKVYALEKGIDLYQPETLKNEAILDILKKYDPEMIVVTAYGKILPLYVLDYPKYRCVNVHASLLPLYRGAAPIQRAIIDGQKVTGVTTMYMEKGLDTGDILEKAEVKIEENDNFESVHDKLASAGAKLIVSTVKGLEEGRIKSEKQDDSLTCYAAKIENEDCVIDFNDNAENVFNRIRGLSPIPLAFCRYKGKTVKIISAYIKDSNENGTAGKILALDKGVITVMCKDKPICITSLKPEGKKAMTAKDCINGRMFEIGDILC